MIEGALIALAGILVGRYMPHRKKHVVLGGEKEALCGCEHHIALHDPKLGACYGQVANPAFEHNLNVSESNRETVQCPCRQYVGPEPVEKYFATATLPPVS